MVRRAAGLVVAYLAITAVLVALCLHASLPARQPPPYRLSMHYYEQWDGHTWVPATKALPGGLVRCESAACSIWWRR